MHAVYRDAPSSGKRTLWRKDCSITTATSEVRVRHLPAGLGEGAGELESYREIIAYARSRGCIPIYLARASGFSVHVHRAKAPTPATIRVVLGALLCAVCFALLVLHSCLVLADSFSLLLSFPLTLALLVSREHDNNTI